MTSEDVEITLNGMLPNLSSNDDSLSTDTKNTSMMASESHNTKVSLKLNPKEYKYRDVIRNKDQRRALKG